MKNVSKYLWTGAKEAFIPFEEGDVSTKCSRNIKSYCLNLGLKAETETIYACDREGKGYRFLHVILDKPVERKHEWNKQS